MNSKETRVTRIKTNSWISTLAVAVVLVCGSGSSAMGATGEMAGQDAMDEDVADEDEEDHQRMLELSAEGNELYEAGQFEEAAGIYQQAWEAYNEPILLKNQMITRYLIEECERAIELGEQFLETGEASDEDKEDVEAVFGECSLDLAEEAVADEQWIDADEWLEFGEPYLFEAQLEREADELRARIDEEAPASEVEDVEDPAMSTREIAGWSIGGAGAATLLGAGIWHVRWERAQGRVDEMSDEELREHNERYDTIRWAVPMMYGIGLTAGLTGAGMLLWPRIAGDDEASAYIGPDVGTDRAGAMLRISF